MLLNKTKQPQKNKIDILIVGRAGEINNVKIKLHQNKSIMTKDLENITSISVFSSSLTSSILGRLYRNLI